MANVNIYAEHRDILDALITSGKVASVAAATKTGPFKEQRDAYVFAASIALALNTLTPKEKMPTSRQGVTTIRDSVFLGAAGAKEVAITVALCDQNKRLDIEEPLARQLELISDANLQARFVLLDRYAHAGFSWLANYQEDESSVRDLVLAAIDQIECVESALSDQPAVNDPLFDMLDMKL